jgi:hypothetical protein
MAPFSWRNPSIARWESSPDATWGTLLQLAAGSTSRYSSPPLKQALDAERRRGAMTITFTLHGTTYSIACDDVLAVARREPPEPITGYYCEVEDRRFPPTQLVRLAARTRTRPHPVNSRTILGRLGFPSYPIDQGPQQRKEHASTTAAAVTPDDLAHWRRRILRILDRLDGRPAALGPTARIHRLTDEKRVPRTIAAHMRVVLEHRNAAEYEDVVITEAEGVAVRGSWNAVWEWASKEQLEV